MRDAIFFSHLKNYFFSFIMSEDLAKFLESFAVEFFFVVD